MAGFRIAHQEREIVPRRIRNEQMNIDLVPMPPIDLLKQTFELDPSIPHGLRWKDRPRDQFRHAIGHKLFASRWPGKPAGSFCGKYYRFSFTYQIDGQWVSVQLHNHRVIWALFNEKDPGPSLVDHSDIDGKNNDGENLRLADSVQSSQNRNRRADNISGVTGIAYRQDVGKWRVRITVDKKLIQVGHYDTKEEAIEARRLAERQYFGAFAPARQN